MSNSRYTDGSYLEATGGTWHLEDAPFKATQVLRILTENGVRPETVCEIGCGAGGVLAELVRVMPRSRFTGYEISPQAYAISQEFSGDRCGFVLGDAFKDGQVYDLALVMDVVEHVEDPFAFLRAVGVKARYKVYHIPLDVHCSAVLRGCNAWDSVGHIHLFTIETALKSIEYSNQRVLDWMLTDGAIGGKRKTWRTRAANAVRAPLAQLSKRFAARLLGGYSILILAE